MFAQPPTVLLGRRRPWLSSDIRAAIVVRSTRMEMTILERDDGITHVALAGRLDTNAADQLEKQFSEATGGRTVRRLWTCRRSTSWRRAELVS